MVKYIAFILLFFWGQSVVGQEHYNVTFDSTYIAAIMQENVIINGYIYGVGGAICSTGECGYLTKYTKRGEVLWTKEYAQIDINSGQVMHYRGGKIYVTGRAKDSIATKTLVLDTLGNVEEEWNYSVTGAITNFSKEVYYDEDHYYYILSEDLGGDLRGALYKCDFEGNLVDRLVFPKLEFTVPIAVRAYQGNLLVSINHRYEESCPFGLNGISDGATYLAEVDKETMTIVRDKKDVCYKRNSNDIYISPTTEIIRTVILRDTLQEGSDGNLGVIYYDTNWEVKHMVEYEHELAKGISNLKYTKDGKYYFVTIGENVPQTDGSSWPFGDMLIQKWTSDHNLLWEKRYYSHSKKKRLKARNFIIDEAGSLHVVGFVDPDFPFTTTFDFWMISVDSEGCHNGDCREAVDLDNLVSTVSILPYEQNAFAYPNPVGNRLYVKTLEGGEEVVLLDTYGRLIDKLTYTAEGMEVGHLSKGVYFLAVDSAPVIRFIKL